MLPKIQKIFRTHWKIAILIILVIFAGQTVFNVYRRYQDSRASLALAEKELAVIENKKAVLEESTAELKTEQGIEEAIRQKYQVTKNGERLIVIVDDEQRKPIETSGKPIGIWQSVLKFFGYKRN